MSIWQRQGFRLLALVFLGIMSLSLYAVPGNQVARFPEKTRVDAYKLPPAGGQKVQLFGHVTLVEGYAVPGYTGCHALVMLRDKPGVTVAVMTTEVRLQSLLETALATGNLMCFWGQKLTNPPTPMGGTWTVDVYSLDAIILYNMK